MLEIKKGEPWIFWPSSICDTFPINPANKKLNFENLKKSIFRLIHPDQMGNLFKVLIVSKNKI